MNPHDHYHQSGRTDVPTPGALSGALSRILGPMGSRTEIPFRVTFSNGAMYQNREGPPRFAITFKSRRAELAVLRFGHVGLLESYFDGRRRRRRRHRAGVSRGVRRALRQPGAERAGRDAQPLARVPFLQPLDRSGQGQRALPLRSGRAVLPALARPRRHDVHLRLLEGRHDDAGGGAAATRWTTSAARSASSAGETFVDVGCGWGGLLFHAWEHYGAHRHRHQRRPPSRSTSSRAKLARARACRQALGGRVRLPRDARPVRQAAVDRHARARGPRSA